VEITMVFAAGGVPVSDQYDQLSLSFDAHHKALWCTWHPHQRPCFNRDLLAELRAFQEDLVEINALALDQGEPLPIRYTILASGTPGVFNLGGDLELFARMIRQQNRDQLMDYATACIDVLYPNAVSFNQPMTTISLVQGEALAGGFEAAIASNVVIAERSSRFGLPEVLFNLIPGMGAYTFLIRKVSPDMAERMILSGQVYTAEQMHELGLVDVVVEDGQGEVAVDAYLANHHRHANTYATLRQFRQTVNPVTYKELIDITTIWVDAALKLSERDLRMIDRLVRAQNRSFMDQDPPQAMVGQA